MTFWRKQNHRDSKEISGSQEMQEEGEKTGRAQDI